MRVGAGRVLFVAGAFAAAAVGQSILDQADFQYGQFAGLHVYSVSLFSGYYSSAYPLTRAGIVAGSQPGLASLGSEWSYGASAAVGWQRHRPRGNMNVMYTGSYSGMAHYSQLSGYNQTASIQFDHMLTRSWTATLSASGQDTTRAESVFQPGRISVISSVPATMDDLAAALSVGQFTDNQVASMLTGTPYMDTPAQSFLFGDRIRAYSLRAGVTYQHSNRLTIDFASFAAGGQQLVGGAPDTANAFRVPRSMGANGGVDIKYALSARTELGFQVDESKNVSRYQNALVSNGTVSLGRKMGERWFTRVYGGGSYSQITRHVYDVPRTRQLIGGASLGIRTHTQTVLATYDRSSRDNFGLAVGTVTSLNGSWMWRRPGSSRTFYTGLTSEQMRNTGFVSLSGWQATAGMAQNLTRHSSLVLEYAFLKTAGTYVGVSNDLSVHMLRLSLRWRPQPVRN